jgi:DNA-binding transcriptional LysR family regulator
MARPTQGALTARRIGTAPVRLYAHRRYIEAHGIPDRLDAPGFSAIGFDRDLQTQRALEERQLPLTKEFFAFRSDGDLAQLAALRAGFGIGACQTGIARRDPDLVPVLQDQFRFDMEVWVAMHEDLRTSRRMRLMFNWLADGLGAYLRESR